MADGSPPNPPPAPNDPWLEGLTFEQVVQLVDQVTPDVFYQRAAAFDLAGARLQDVLDQVRHEMNLVRGAWTGAAAEDFDALVREVTGRVTTDVLQFLQNPGYGATLRAAGDRLADHQRRLRDLQGQKAQQESQPPVPGAPAPEVVAQANNDSAKQILRDLRTAYWEIGNQLAPLSYKPPQVVAETTTNNPSHQDGTTGDGAGERGHGGGGPGLFAAGGPPLALVAPRRQDAGPGEWAGGERYGFGGQGGQVLGRVDTGGAAGQFGGAGSETAHQPVPAPVLGQNQFVAQDSVPGGVPPITGVAPAVLGRSETRQSFCGPAATGTGRLTATGGTDGVVTPGRTRKSATTLPEERPETESVAEVLPARERVAGAPATEERVAVRTAVDAPQETVTTAREALVREIAAKAVPGVAVSAAGQPVGAAHAVSAAGQPVVTAHGVSAAGQPVAAQPVTAAAGVPVPATPVVDGKPAVAGEPLAAARKAFAVSAGGSAGGVVNAALDPQSRGMFLPGTATPDALVAPVGEPVTGQVVPGQVARGAPVDPYGSHMGGYPMAPMMGGMGGSLAQQNGRMSAVPNEPRPDVWDPAHSAPNAVGRREREPERDQDDQKVTKEEIQARLTEKFAELDRLMERGR